VAVGPVKASDKFHCQAAVISEDGFSYKFYHYWDSDAIETAQDPWFDPTEYVPVKQFFYSNKRWQK
jgi:hypothetical protein